MSETWTIYTDGGTRGNPGPAAYAYVIKRPGQADLEEKAYLGKTTNNIAEYTGLVEALKHAKQLGGKKLIVKSDSELMVKQMNGEYRVKNEGLRRLFQQASALHREFESVAIKHIYREDNAHADALCNEALDDAASLRREQGEETSRASDQFIRSEYSQVSDSTILESTRASATLTPLMQALVLMKSSANQWAKGDANDPPPAEVLNKLVGILQSQDASAAD